MGRKGLNNITGKTYADYLKDDVEKGNISKKDAIYYKNQNKTAVKNGHGGVFHGKIR